MGEWLLREEVQPPQRGMCIPGFGMEKRWLGTSAAVTECAEVVFSFGPCYLPVLLCAPSQTEALPPAH